MAVIMGTKVGMTAVYVDHVRVPVTVISANPNTISAIRDSKGYQAVQLAYGERKAKNTTKAEQGHLRKAGLDVLDNFPKSSPDLNAIECWWHRLRQKLLENDPVEFEGRPEFLKRLRRTVTWLNDNAGDEGVHVATNLKERASEVQQKQKGARCRW